MMLPVFHLQRMLPESLKSQLRFISRRLPRSWFFLTNDRRYWWLTGEADLMRQRPNLSRHDLQEGCFLETYMNDQVFPDGINYFGPAVCLVVHDFDVMRFDCLDFPMGHYHTAKPYPYGISRGLAGNIWLPEKSIEAQVDRAIFELLRNADHYVLSHAKRKVRNTRLDEARMTEVCAEVKAKMLEDTRQRRARDLPVAATG